MSKKRKKNQAKNGGDASTEPSAPASNGAAAVAEAPVPPRSGLSAPRTEGRLGPRRLMDTLEPDTSATQLLLMVAAMLAVPTVVALVVKIAILPLFKS